MGGTLNTHELVGPRNMLASRVERCRLLSICALLSSHSPDTLVAAVRRTGVCETGRNHVDQQEWSRLPHAVRRPVRFHVPGAGRRATLGHREYNNAHLQLQRTSFCYDFLSIYPTTRPQAVLGYICLLAHSQAERDTKRGLTCSSVTRSQEEPLFDGPTCYSSREVSWIRLNILNSDSSSFSSVFFFSIRLPEKSTLVYCHGLHHYK